jgi:hypothetical protein
MKKYIKKVHRNNFANFELDKPYCTLLCYIRNDSQFVGCLDGIYQGCYNSMIKSLVSI